MSVRVSGQEAIAFGSAHHGQCGAGGGAHTVTHKKDFFSTGAVRRTRRQYPAADVSRRKSWVVLTRGGRLFRVRLFSPLRFFFSRGRVSLYAALTGRR